MGGATVSLHLTDNSVIVRTTKDVDLVIEVSRYAEYAKMEEGLGDHGFEQKPEGDGPLCRWEKGGLLLDLLPTKPEILGFTQSEWFTKGFEKAREYELPNGEVIEAFGAIHLLPAKIEAFEDRGDGDWHTTGKNPSVAKCRDQRVKSKKTTGDSPSNRAWPS